MKVHKLFQKVLVYFQDFLYRTISPSQFRDFPSQQANKIGIEILSIAKVGI